MTPFCVRHSPAVSLCRRADGGSVCEGVSRVYKLCNTVDCPASAVDFRSAQCAEFNTKPFRSFYYRWKPYQQFKGMCCLHTHKHTLVFPSKGMYNNVCMCVFLLNMQNCMS